ncbi:MAG: M14 family zinc carboxypeptidase, partial [Planctomycetota bacterium]|nr:M14 family zinc carboxypeptidase [Planctomycetota bacterium]
MAVIQTILVCLYIFLPTVDPQDARDGVGDPGSEGKQEAAQMPPASLEDSPSFSDHARLTMRLTGLERRAPEMASVDVVGLSDEDRQVWMLRLARPGDRDPDERPAILVVAGLGATRVGSTEIVLTIAERLVAEAGKVATSRDANGDETEAAESEVGLGDFLTGHTLYMIPRVNVDGAEWFLQSIVGSSELNGTPIDDDRDGIADDDPPEDLNGDGIITLMRVRDPEATHIEDPDEPRLMREADRANNERPVFKIYSEGIDNDGDGEYNEDGLGGVDPNRNFPHAYPELGPGAGAHQLSAPEARGLADFVLGRPNIAAVVVYGRHDNLIEVPEDKARDVSGRGYRHLHPDDSAIYKHLSEGYSEITGLKGSPKTDDAGSFHGWTYNQRGLPTFATTAWWIPEEEKEDSEAEVESATSQPDSRPASRPADSSDDGPTSRPATEEAATSQAASTRPASQPAESPDDGATSQPTTDEAATSQPASTQPAGLKNGKPKKGDKKDPLKVDRKWLKYSDEQRGGSGFVSWSAFEHPQLGPVEIGGFVPGFRENPPIES